MIKLLFATHGMLASGMKHAIELLSGEAKQLTVIDAYIDKRNFVDDLNDFINSCDPSDQIILLSDIYGGSVNQEMYKVLDHKSNITLICGVNMPLVLELILINEEHLSDDKIDELILQSQKGIKRLEFKNIEESTDDFF